MPSSSLTCTFDSDDPGVQVILSAATTGRITTSTSSFGWHVLETLADEADLEETPPAAPEENWTVTITLTKIVQAGSYPLAERSTSTHWSPPCWGVSSSSLTALPNCFAPQAREPTFWHSAHAARAVSSAARDGVFRSAASDCASSRKTGICDRPTFSATPA